MMLRKPGLDAFLLKVYHNPYKKSACIYFHTAFMVAIFVMWFPNCFNSPSYPADAVYNFILSVLLLYIKQRSSHISSFFLFILYIYYVVDYIFYG